MMQAGKLTRQDKLSLLREADSNLDLSSNNRAGSGGASNRSSQSSRNSGKNVKFSLQRLRSMPTKKKACAPAERLPQTKQLDTRRITASQGDELQLKTITKPKSPATTPTRSSRGLKLNTDIFSEYYDDDGALKPKEEDNVETPRTRYSNVREKHVQDRMNVLVSLGTTEMKIVRRGFEEKAKENEPMKMLDFVELVQGSIGDSEKNEHVDALCEIFREVDVNGDGDMTWDEFTSYLVELANHYYEDKYQSLQANYELSQTYVDSVRHDYVITWVKHLPNIHKLACIDGNSRRFRVYDENLCQLGVYGHKASIITAEYIPDLRQLVTSTNDKKLVFWDMDPRKGPCKVVRMWETERSFVSMNWDGRYLYAGDTSNHIVCWNVMLGRAPRRLIGHTDLVMALETIPEQRLLASGSLDTTIKLWDVEYSSCTKTLRGHSQAILALKYSNTNNLLISGGLDSSALCWSSKLEKPVHEIKGLDNDAHVIGIETIDGTSHACIADSNGGFQIIDLRMLLPVQRFRVTKDVKSDMSCLTCIQRRGMLVAGCMKLHAFQKLQDKDESVADDLPITFAQFNPVSMTFITAAGRSVKIWDALTSRLNQTFENVTEEAITALCLDNRMRRIFVGDHHGNIKVLNYANGAFMKRMDAHAREVTCLLHHGEELFSCSWDREVRSHNDEINVRETTTRRVQLHTDDITSMALFESLKLVATGGADGRVNIHSWRAGVGALLHRIEINAGVTAMLPVPGKALLIVCTSKGEIAFRMMKGTFDELTSVQNMTNGLPSVVVGMDYDDERMVLWTADEGGYVKSWPLEDLIGALDEAEASPHSARNTPAMHTRRRRSVVAHLIPEINEFNVEQGLEQITEAPSPVVKKIRRPSGLQHNRTMSIAAKFGYIARQQRLTLRSTLSIHAHEDRCNGVQHIPMLEVPSSVLTWGFDGRVMLWNAVTGKSLGSLQQGFNKKSLRDHEPWHFEVDLSLRLEKESQFHQQALDLLAKHQEGKRKAQMEKMKAEKERLQRNGFRTSPSVQQVAALLDQPSVLPKLDSKGEVVRSGLFDSDGSDMDEQDFLKSVPSNALGSIDLDSPRLRRRSMRARRATNSLV